MKTDLRYERPLAPYFILVVVLTIPLWLLSKGTLPLPVRLPVSALEFLIPAVAASILVYRQGKLSAVKRLFSRAFDFRRIQNRAWYLPALLLNPAVFLLSYAILRLYGTPMPDAHVAWAEVPVYFMLFFVAAIFEELGWTAYATEPLQNRRGALAAGLLLGGFWAVYHLIPDLQNQQPAGWIFWHRLGTVTVRVLTVWVYNGSGKSVFAAVLFHAMNNLSWAMFPTYGSYYTPAVTTPLLVLAAAAAVWLWGPRTLSRYRFDQPES